MKRRLFSLALALAIILGLATPAFASGSNYEVVYKSDLKGSANTAYNDVALFSPSSASGRKLARFTGSSIEYITNSTYKSESKIYSCGYAIVNYNSVINAQGETIIPSGTYDYIDIITNDGYALARNNVNDTRECYLINLKNNSAIKAPDNSYGYGSGLFLVREGANYYYVNINGNKVAGPYGYSSAFCNGYAWVALVENSREAGWEIIDTSGNTVHHFETTKTYYTFGNDTEIPDEVLYSLYYRFPANGNGREVSPDGLIKVAEKYWKENSYDRIGYTDLNGNIVIPCEYDINSSSFLNGYAVVEKVYENNDRQIGLIDTKGNTIIPIGQYKKLSNVSETGLIWATDQEGYLSILKVTPHPSSLTMPTTTAAPSTPTTPVEPTPTPSTTGFIDVSTDAYYAEAVTWAINKGITNGTGTNTFSPNENCSNAQIITFLWRAKGQPEPTGSNPFTNISTNDYYYKAAIWAYENGLVSGGIFDVNTPCTRATTVTYMWIASGRPAPTSSTSFSDVPATASYAAAVSWAVENNITNGDGDNKFSPDKVCNRGQIVTFLNRAFG